MASKRPGTETAAGPAELEYVARYGGWNRQNLKLVVLALVFCAAALLPTMPLWLRVTDLAFFGGGTLLLLGASLGRPVALRVDAAGITLRRTPLFRGSTAQTYPWPEVEQIVIWGAYRMDYVGVRRAPGAAPLSGRFNGPTSARVAAMTSGLRAEVALTGVPANNWVLDRARLRAAVAQFAPQVQVVDLTTPNATAAPAS
jgi:hypothetical protein